MRQMMNLPPTTDRPGTTFIAMFLPRLPSELRDHLIAKDFKDCTLMADYADLPNSSQACCSVATVNPMYEVAIKAMSGGGRTPSPQQEKNDVSHFHTTFSDKAKKYKPGCKCTVSWRIRIFNCIEEVPRFFFL